MKNDDPSDMMGKKTMNEFGFLTTKRMNKKKPLSHQYNQYRDFTLWQEKDLKKVLEMHL